MGFVVRAARVLKVLALFWCAGALLRMLFALSGGNTVAVNVHFVLLVVGGLVYWAAYKLAKLPPDGNAGAVATVKARWWGSSFAFRVIAFLAGAWVIASWIGQDSYDRDWNWILGPALGLLAAYWVFTALVIKQDAPPGVPPTHIAPEEPKPSLSKTSPQESAESSAG